VGDATIVGDRHPGRTVQTSTLQRLGLLAAGLVVALVLLELGLRAGGWVFLWLQDQRNRASLREDSPYRILCIGESTTALGGKDAYPAQLERVLNENAGRPVVSVINRGVPATNTSAIVARLPALLDQYRPDAVVAMMGANDGDVPPPGRVGSALRSLRVCKLALHAWHLARGQPGAVPTPADAAMTKERRLRARIAANDADVGAYVELGTLYLAQARLDEARPLLEHALTVSPRDEPGGLGLALIEHRQGASRPPEHALPGTPPEVARDYLTLFDESEAARSLATHLIATFASDDAAYRLVTNSYFSTAGRFMREGRLDEAEELLELAAHRPGHRTRELYHGWLALIAEARGDERTATRHRHRARTLRRRHEEAHTSTARNYRAMHGLLRSRGIRLVAVQYPLRDVESLRRMLGDDPSVLFVDNERPFREALQRAPYGDFFIDAFAGDFGHLTPHGNRLLAETVAHAVATKLLASSSTGGRS
jgi:lysophospholipase L1-like esterase